MHGLRVSLGTSVDPSFLAASSLFGAAPQTVNNLQAASCNRYLLDKTRPAVATVMVIRIETMQGDRRVDF